MDTQQAGHELAAIRRMPYGLARTAAAEAIARRIEAEGPQERLPEALLDLVEAYTFTDDGHKAFVPFARLLRLWDANPALFDETDQRNLFWEFKWVAGDLADYPQITADQAREFLAEMGRRYDMAGKGRRAVANLEFTWAWQSGDPNAADALTAWTTSPQDDLDDCRACFVGKQTDYYVTTGQFAKAVEIGSTQRDRCNLEPARTYSALALAYLEQGDADNAAAAHRRMLATLDSSTSDFAPARGQEFELLARGGHVDRALLRLRNEYPALLTKASTPLFRLRFLLGVLAGLSANLDRADLPTGLDDPALSTLGALHAWVKAEASKDAAAFDARNGNDFYARQVARSLDPGDAGLVLDLDIAALAHGAGATSAPSGLSSGGALSPGSPSTASPSADGTAPDDAMPADPLSQAEIRAAASDYVGAAACYAQAAETAETAGLLEDAGLAWAESAHCAQEAADDATAHARYGLAMPRLRAAGSAVDLVVQVVGAWAPVAARMGETAGVLDGIAAALAQLDAEDTSGLADDLAAVRRRQVTRMRASLLDVFARTVASTPAAQRTPGRELPDAIRAATDAGTQFAQAGATTDAAYAFWLAGTLQRESGETQDALWSLESAFEGFTMARQTAPRAEAAGEFIELLRATGQFAKADEVVASLA